MKLVSKFAILLVILLGSWPEEAEAQWPNRFYVGSYFVRCDLDTINGIGSWPHYIQAVQNETDNWQGWWNPNPPSEDWRYRILPEVRFDQMEDLGLNMAEFTIQPEHLLSDPHPRNRGNVVTDLNNRIAARAVAGHADLEMCITDPYINAVSGAERLMFHPEVTADFAEPGPFQTADDNDFENFPNLNLRIGRQLGFLEGSGPNCRKMEDPGTINGLTGVRKRELSVCGRYNAEADTSAGRWQRCRIGIKHAVCIRKYSTRGICRPAYTSTS